VSADAIGTSLRDAARVSAYRHGQTMRAGVRKGGSMCATNGENTKRCGTCGSLLGLLERLAREYQTWPIDDQAKFHGESVDIFKARMAAREKKERN
jgi:hypothetical protein